VLNGIHGDFVVKEYEIPDPEPGTLLLKVELSGICGTDEHIYHGRMLAAERFPLVLGHEVVGTIAALGPGLDRDLFGRAVKEGDRVCPIGAMSCNECYYCTVLHAPSRCPNKQTFGFYREPDAGSGLLGGMPSTCTSAGRIPRS
jgi:L-iditol 2-dehydrogenase